MRDYNAMIRKYADYGANEAQPGNQYGKRIPYIGWFWRLVDFDRRIVPIGDCGEFVGFMENNKWDYPERTLTDTEVDAVLAVLNRAYHLFEHDNDPRPVLDEIWPLMQTFKVNP